MRTFIGTKIIDAEPEARDGADGMAVVYGDGYRSWSPRDVFEAHYEPMTRMSFSHALHLLRGGSRLARAGWNGRDMFLFLVPGSTFMVNRPPLLGIYPEGTQIDYHPHIDMKTAQGYVVPWLASQADLLSDDWYVVAPAAAADDQPNEPLPWEPDASSDEAE